jgi:hypothetical protein
MSFLAWELPVADFISTLMSVNWFGDFFILRMLPTGLGVYLAMKLTDREEGRKNQHRRRALLAALKTELELNAELLRHILGELDDARITSTVDLSLIRATAWEQVNLFSDSAFIKNIQSLRFKLMHISRQLDAQIAVGGKDRKKVLAKLEDSSKQVLPELEALAKKIVEKLASGKL